MLFNSLVYVIYLEVVCLFHPFAFKKKISRLAWESLDVFHRGVGGSESERSIQISLRTGPEQMAENKGKNTFPHSYIEICRFTSLVLEYMRIL